MEKLITEKQKETFKKYFPIPFVTIRREYYNGILSFYYFKVGRRAIRCNIYPDNTAHFFYYKPLKEGQKRRSEIMLRPKNGKPGDKFSAKYAKKHYEKFRIFEKKAKKWRVISPKNYKCYRLKGE